MAISMSKRVRVRLLAVACGAALLPAATLAQAPPPDALDPGELDPDAPLDAMPDLGVDWPDMNAPDPVVEMAPGEPAETGDIGGIEDSVAARRYVLTINGLGERAGREDRQGQGEQRVPDYVDPFPHRRPPGERTAGTLSG